MYFIPYWKEFVRLYKTRKLIYYCNLRVINNYRMVIHDIYFLCSKNPEYVLHKCLCVCLAQYHLVCDWMNVGFCPDFWVLFLWWLQGQQYFSNFFQLSGKWRHLPYGCYHTPRSGYLMRDLMSSWPTETSQHGRFENWDEWLIEEHLIPIFSCL